MRSSRLNYVVVGGFVLAMIAALVVTAALLTGRTGATDTYYAVYQNIAGVKFGTQVLFEGYPIGQVEAVAPEPSEGGMRFRVVLEVTEGWRIPIDSVAEIAAPGLLAAVTVSIHAGTNPLALRPGSEIKARQSRNIFAMLSSVASDVTALSEQSLKPLLENLNHTVQMVGVMLEGDVRELVGELTRLTTDLAERTPRIADKIEVVADSLNRSSGELEALLKPENRQKLEGMLDDMDSAAANFAEISAVLQATLGKLDRLIVETGGLVANNKEGVQKSLSDLRYVTDSVSRHIDSINLNLEGAARNMYEFSRQIRQNPGLLLGGQPQKGEAARQ